MPARPGTAPASRRLSAPVPIQEISPRFALAEVWGVKLDPGGSLRAWGVRAVRVKELKVQLLVISNGKSRMAQEATYTWDKWPDGQTEASWEVLYLLQDGSPFGLSDKRVPTLAVDFGAIKPTSTASQRSAVPVDGKFGSWHQTDSSMTTLSSGRQHVIYAEMYANRSSRPGWRRCRGSRPGRTACGPGQRTIDAGCSPDGFGPTSPPADRRPPAGGRAGDGQGGLGYRRWSRRATSERPNRSQFPQSIRAS